MPAVPRVIASTRRLHAASAGSVLLLTGIIATLACGCLNLPGLDVLSARQQPVYTLGLHQFARRDIIGGRLGRTLTNEVGESVHVRAIPVLSSHSIFRAEVARDAAGRPALKAFLDPHGRMLWAQACAELAGAPIAVVVNGFYRFSIVVPRSAAADPDAVLISGPWNEPELAKVAAAAADNYRKLGG